MGSQHMGNPRHENMEPWIALGVNICGYTADIMVSPGELPPTFRERNRFVIMFKDLKVKTGAPILIIEYSDLQADDYEWIAIPSSPITGRDDLVQAAGKIIDEYYKKPDKEA